MGCESSHEAPLLADKMTSSKNYKQDTPITIKTQNETDNPHKDLAIAQEKASESHIEPS